MRYVKLGRTGLEVSPIALGCMTYGGTHRGYPVWSLPEEEVAQLQAPYTPRADPRGQADDARIQELSVELGIAVRAPP